MNDKLKELLAIPTQSYQEQQMVAYLKARLVDSAAKVWSDQYNNVYAVRGTGSKPFPCLAAHIDSVQPIRKVRVVEDGGFLRGIYRGKPAGLGADDKTGIHVCLELFEQFDNIALMLFATEECGCHGARHADPAFFKLLGYVIEYDCPSRNMLSHTVSGVRLFANRGDFIFTAAPVLKQFGTMLWQNHPYTDVMAVRQRFPLSCLNLSSGYYNWHASNEFVKVSDVALAIEQGEALVRALGDKRYPFAVAQLDEDAPLVPIGPLFVPKP